jgi:hypothetical protein
MSMLQQQQQKKIGGRPSKISEKKNSNIKRLGAFINGIFNARLTVTKLERFRVKLL